MNEYDGLPQHLQGLSREMVRSGGRASTAGVDGTHVGKRVQWHGQQLRGWLA